MIYGTAAEFDDLSLGMSRAEVVEILGSPAAVQADGDKDEVYLIFKKMEHAISDWPRTYRVTLRDGKVVKWSEQ
ncbi:outer membrane protein assembly factor BamE [Alkalilimnicola sp. S0819]|uniref:outer membrane protein assembly factor BamE domain-containing protein n=1 Tax=Alkalilimnicola sp. S0819 TaxID=2613922 RepID=UPI00186A4DB9|nr:outer membrane protein assembly factor BamE [Alkalilimnicola sp. S0819]